MSRREIADNVGMMRIVSGAGSQLKRAGLIEAHRTIRIVIKDLCGLC
jgi:DNA-binding transcriptional regulator YhcF (GntR family)